MKVQIPWQNLNFAWVSTYGRRQSRSNPIISGEYMWGFTELCGVSLWILTESNVGPCSMHERMLYIKHKHQEVLNQVTLTYPRREYSCYTPITFTPWALLKHKNMPSGCCSNRPFQPLWSKWSKCVTVVFPLGQTCRCGFWWFTSWCPSNENRFIWGKTRTKKMQASQSPATTPLYCSDEVRVVMGFVVINALYPHT